VRIAEPVLPLSLCRRPDQRGDVPATLEPFVTFLMRTHGTADIPILRQDKENVMPNPNRR
jgi:hypothetical protein